MSKQQTLFKHSAPPRLQTYREEMEGEDEDDFDHDIFEQPPDLLLQHAGVVNSGDSYSNMQHNNNNNQHGRFPSSSGRRGGSGPNMSTAGSSVGSSYNTSLDGDEQTTSSVTTFHSQRQDSKWRRKTTSLLENSNMEQQEGQARRAGLLASEHFWKLAMEMNPASATSTSTLWYSTKLSDVASAESFDFDEEDDDDEDTSEGNSNASSQKKKKKRNSSFRSLFSSAKQSADSSTAQTSGNYLLSSDDVLTTNQSLTSSERAIRRGIRRGKREGNEEKRLSEDTPHSETQTVDTGGRHWLFHKFPTPTRSNNNRLKKKRLQRLRSGGSRAINFIINNMANPYPAYDDEDADAWMCGVCGKAFTTLEAADKHEQDHIQEVVDYLPWIQKEKVAKVAAAAEQPSTPASLDNASQSATSLIRTGNTTAQDGAATRDGEIFHRVMGGLPQQEQHPDSKEMDDPFLTPKMSGKKPPKKRISFDSPLHEAGEEEGASLRTPPGVGRSAPLPDELLDEVLGVGEEDFDDHNDGSIIDDQLQLPEAQVTTPLMSHHRISHFGEQEEEKEEIAAFDDNHPFDAQQGPVESSRQFNDDSHNQMQQTPADWPIAMEGVGQNILIPRLRSEARFHQEDAAAAAAETQDMLPVRDIDPLLSENAGAPYSEPQEALLLSSAMQDYVILADEALVTVCEKARKLILNQEEMIAEQQLSYLAKDKLYYDDLANRARIRKRDPGYEKYKKRQGKGLVGKVQNKFVDAYTLMKEGTDKKGFRDEYETRMKKGAQGGATNQKLVVHNQRTMYLNVMVKNGIQVVKNELERMAQERWENEQDLNKFTRFERFRVYAHTKMVRLAGLALSSDFTPRRIAVQLSNDIYRLLTPRLKRKGVAIETEIEYRVGPYFVLAINVLNINWRRLLKATHRDVELRRARWEKLQEQEREKERQGEDKKKEDGKRSAFKQFREYLVQVMQLTQHDIVASMLAILFHTHWLFYEPVCIICYYTLFGSAIRQFILSSVADDIFYYVEEKGMEMEIGIRKASVQAAFMLNALREIRADSKDHKKKQEQSATSANQNLLGPLLGPLIPADKNSAEKPADFEVPENLEFVGLELDLDVGFRRLRWAILNTQSTFLSEALYRTEAKYDNITMGTWDHHNEFIGAPKLPDTVNQEDFLGAEKVCSYLMPKSAFVKANMCTETHFVLAYNDYCFTLKKKALTPDVPYGSTFVAWTQFTVINTGDHTCRLICSVEPEFPNGPPLVSRQIKSGMRAGVGELFVLIGETIAKYADAYP